AKILLLGNILPIEDNPVRMAEQLAMADLISGGRVLSGFVRGVGVETWWSNSNPVHNRERFEECHDLILKCWTEPGPFRWEGRHSPFPPRDPGALAVAEAASADLDPRYRQPGDGGVGRAPRLHLRAVPGALRDRARAVRVLPPRRGRSRAHGDAGQPGLPDLRCHGRDEGQGARGRTPLRLAHGADLAGARRVVRAGRHALARRIAIRAARAASVAGNAELRGAGGRPVHRRRDARRGDRALRPRAARARGRPSP